MHPLNIFSKFSTCSTLKFDKFNKVRFEQSWNIEFIWVTLSVLKFDKSKLSNEEQLQNIFSIFKTEWVWKLDKSNEIKFLQL